MSIFDGGSHETQRKLIAGELDVSFILQRLGSRVRLWIS